MATILETMFSQRPNVSINEVTCTSLLHRLNFRYFSEYTANLYRGCTHACDYCYAPSLIHDERAWGKYVDAKINAPDVLRKEIRHAKIDTVFLSSASDPYQPVEARYKLTRKCLEALLEHQFPVLILTRSPLVLRDVDIIEKFSWIRVGFSISSVSDRFHEPGVVPIEKRLEAMSKLKDHGIATWVSLAPVIPGVPMIDLERLFQRMKEIGVSAVSTGLLRFNGYAESKKMFEERARMSASDAVRGGIEIMEKIHELAATYEVDDSDSLLSWRSADNDGRLDSYG